MIVYLSRKLNLDDTFDSLPAIALGKFYGHDNRAFEMVKWREDSVPSSTNGSNFEHVPFSYMTLSANARRSLHETVHLNSSEHLLHFSISLSLDTMC